MSEIKRFADYGSEKMIYDIRMGPQALRCGNKLYVCYQANDHEIFADPHIVEYDMEQEVWSSPVKVGEVERGDFDHHLAPVIWMDPKEHIHVLFNCHGDAGVHLVSDRPRDIRSFSPCTRIADSISYPHAIRCPDGRVALYYRSFGHMGNWNYVISRDGGYTWTKPVMTVDFDAKPLSDADCWAGSYHSVQLDPDGKTLHVAYTYFDERGIWKYRHPVYHRLTSVNSRYHIYYMTIDLDTGLAKNFAGDTLCLPLNKREADRDCRILDTGWHLTMMPAMCFDSRHTPSFLFPVTEDGEYQCGFYYLYHENGVWNKTRICGTNHTWSGSRLVRLSETHLAAYLIVGKLEGSIYTYGAGQLEKWISGDNGKTWEKETEYIPDRDLLYNNPMLVEAAEDSSRFLENQMVFYGWKGPYSIQPVIDQETDIPTIHRGHAYLLTE